MLVVGLGNLKFMNETITDGATVRGTSDAANDEVAAEGRSPAPMSGVANSDATNGETTKGRLEAIWLKRAHRGQMDEVATAVLVEGQGLEGNADQGGRRQVTILSKERWDGAVSGLEAEQIGSLHPKDRRANLFVSGLDLEDTRGWTLMIGGHHMVIAGETKPCALMDDICDGLQDALRSHWGGGAYAQVVDGGTISVGDEVTLTPPSESN